MLESNWARDVKEQLSLFPLFYVPPRAGCLRVSCHLILYRKRLTCCSTAARQTIPVPNENEWDHAHHQCNETQHGRRPVNPEVCVHAVGCKGQRDCSDGPRHAGSCMRRCRVLAEDVGQIVDHAHKKQLEAASEENAAQHGHDRRHRGPDCPAEPE